MICPMFNTVLSSISTAYHAWHWEIRAKELAEPGKACVTDRQDAGLHGENADLHILWATAAGKFQKPHIPRERVRAARQLAEFYLDKSS
jgi:hypothetical protein